MSISQLYLPYDNSSAAQFRVWAEGISLQLTAAGWTKTTDTGQVDWTTNPAVPAANTYLYEIRQPASDPLQTGATAYYIKISYGNSTSGTNNPDIQISLGTGTNGAGTLTGSIIGPFGLRVDSSVAGQGATPWECDFSWSVSRMGVLLWRNASNTLVPAFFAIERTKDSTGADSSDGVFVVLLGGQNNNYGGFQMRGIIFGVGVTNLIQASGSNSTSGPWLDVGYISNNQNLSDNFNNGVPISPVFPSYGKFGNPLTVMGVVRKVDIAEGVLISTTFYGGTMTYLSSKAGSYFNVLGGLANGSFLMRFD